MNDRNFWLYSSVIATAICGFVCFGARVFNSSGAVVWSWGLVAMAFAGLSVWIFLQKDAVPDILRDQGFSPFERKGLCLVFLPSVENGELILAVLFQNRHANPCTAQVIVKPASSAADCGISTLRLNLQCNGEGAGALSVPWLVGCPRPGKAIECFVGADVEYPIGPGALVRSREGAPIGSIEEASFDELTHFIQTPAKFSFRLPEGIRERTPSETPVLNRESDSISPKTGSSATPPSDNKDSEPLPSISSANVEIKRSGSRPVDVTCEKCRHQYQYTLHRTVTGKGDHLDQSVALQKAEDDATQKLAKILESEADIVPCPQCGQLTSQMRGNVRKNREDGFGMMVGGAIIILVGAGICWGVYWVQNSTGRLFYVIGIFGVLAGVFGVMMIFQGMSSLITGRSKADSERQGDSF